LFFEILTFKWCLS